MAPTELHQAKRHGGRHTVPCSPVDPRETPYNYALGLQQLWQEKKARLCCAGCGDPYEKCCPKCCQGFCRMLCGAILAQLAKIGKKLVAFLFSHVGLCGLVAGYAVLGAFMFRAIELPTELERQGHVLNDTYDIVTQLKQFISERRDVPRKDFEIEAERILKNYERILVAAVNQEGYDGDDEDLKTQWTLSGALLYSFTVITTIGYGHIAPKTQLGRMVTMVYATIGIPLMLMCLANIAESLAHFFTFIYFRICCLYCYWREKRRLKLRRTMNALQRYHGGTIRKALYAGGAVRLATGGLVLNKPMPVRRVDSFRSIASHGLPKSSATAAPPNIYGQERHPSTAGIPGRAVDRNRNHKIPVDWDTRSLPSTGRQYPHRHHHHHNPRAPRLPRRLDSRGGVFTAMSVGAPVRALPQQASISAGIATAMTSSVATNVVAAYSGATSQLRMIPSLMKKQISRASGYIHEIDSGGKAAQVRLLPTMMKRRLTQASERLVGVPEDRSLRDVINYHSPSGGKGKPSLISMSVVSAGLPIVRWVDCPGCKKGSSHDKNPCRCTVCWRMVSLTGSVPGSEDNITSSESSKLAGANSCTPSEFPSEMPTSCPSFPENDHSFTVTSMPQSVQVSETDDYAAHGIPKEETPPRLIVLDDIDGYESEPDLNTKNEGSTPQHITTFRVPVYGSGDKCLETDPLQDCYEFEFDENIPVTAAHSSSALDLPPDAEPYAVTAAETMIVATEERSIVTLASKPSNDEWKRSDEWTKRSEEGSVRSRKMTVASQAMYKQPKKMPVSVGIILLISFIVGGAILFALWEDWNVFNAAYFCFITLTTIGFGDLVPGSSVSGRQDTMIICSLYLLVGMALIAMCFKLMQDDVVQKTRWLGQKIGLLAKEESEEFEDEDEEEEEYSDEEEMMIGENGVDIEKAGIDGDKRTLTSSESSKQALVTLAGAGRT